MVISVLEAVALRVPLRRILALEPGFTRSSSPTEPSIRAVMAQRMVPGLLVLNTAVAEVEAMSLTLG